MAVSKLVGEKNFESSYLEPRASCGHCGSSWWSSVMWSRCRTIVELVSGVQDFLMGRGMSPVRWDAELHLVSQGEDYRHTHTLGRTDGPGYSETTKLSQWPSATKTSDNRRYQRRQILTPRDNLIKDHTIKHQTYNKE